MPFIFGPEAKNGAEDLISPPQELAQQPRVQVCPGSQIHELAVGGSFGSEA